MAVFPLFSRVTVLLLCADHTRATELGRRHDSRVGSAAEVEEEPLSESEEMNPPISTILANPIYPYPLLTTSGLERALQANDTNTTSTSTSTTTTSGTTTTTTTTEEMQVVSSVITAVERLPEDITRDTLLAHTQYVACKKTGISIILQISQTLISSLDFELMGVVVTNSSSRVLEEEVAPTDPGMPIDTALVPISREQEDQRGLAQTDDDRRGEEDIPAEPEDINRSTPERLYPQVYPSTSGGEVTHSYVITRPAVLVEPGGAPRRSLASVSQRVKTLFSIETTMNAAATLTTKLSLVTAADSMKVGGPPRLGGR